LAYNPQKILIQEPRTLFNEKPFALGEKTLPFGIPINARQPVITPNAFSQLIK
jgi:hypothetical protein